MISYNEVKKRIEDMGYFATEELVYDAYNALLMFASKEINPGQDIFAICLEGPPGAGKTEFAKIYTKLANQIFNNVMMVDYQCDATTGKTELFEDINISAAIRGDADNVNIPGKLIKAIKAVNRGNKVVLFIDEYDKAREETDAFLLQFLQSGKINSTQHGDLEIKKEYKNNLQVFICKNDMREELSGPLTRRIRITRLDYMTPEVFFKVANRALVENKKDPVNDGLINLVSLMYQKAYENKEMYNRLPSCSEMLIALEDADRMMKRANAPKNVLYNIIIRNMFKSVDDIETFESSLNRVKNQNESKLAALVNVMKIEDKHNEEIDLNSLIASKVFEGESKKLIEKQEELQKLIDTYKTKFEELKQELEEEKNKIKLANGSLVSKKMPEAIFNFNDESLYVKRDISAYDLSNNDWTEVATIIKGGLSHQYLISNLIKNAALYGVTIYKDGILLGNAGEEKLIVVNEGTSKELPKYVFYCNFPVMSSTLLNDIKNFTIVLNKIYQEQLEKSIKIMDYELLGNSEGYSISALIYNDKALDNNLKIEYPNVYYYNIGGDIITAIDSLKDNIEVKDFNKVVEASKNLLGESRVLTHE